MCCENPLYSWDCQNCQCAPQVHRANSACYQHFRATHNMGSNFFNVCKNCVYIFPFCIHWVILWDVFIRVPAWESLHYFISAQCALIKMDLVVGADLVKLSCVSQGAFMAPLLPLTHVIYMRPSLKIASPVDVLTLGSPGLWFLIMPLSTSLIELIWWIFKENISELNFCATHFVYTHNCFQSVFNYLQNSLPGNCINLHVFIILKASAGSKSLYVFLVVVAMFV